MKKILILLLFLLPIVNAQDITISLSKDNYFQQETLQAEVFINLTLAEEITASNFGLIDKENKTIPIPLFLEEISNNHYFIYFNVPKLNNGTYFFLVKDVKYTDTTLKKISKSQEFYLNNISSISILPAILNRVNSTNLKIMNHGSLINVTIKASEINLNKNLLLQNEFNTNLEIPKNIDNFNIRIDYGDRFYLIPVIPYQETFNEIRSLIIPKNAFILLNSTLGNYFNNKITLTKDSSPNGPFYIKNTLNLPIDNIEFNLTGNLNEIARLNLNHIDEIKANEALEQYIWINENQNPSKLKYSGNIEVRRNGELLAFIPLEIEFEFIEIKIEGNLTKENKMNFNKTTNFTKEQPVGEEQNKNLIIFFVLLILIVIIVLFYFIFKKQKGKDDYEEFLKSK
ncbi:MAG: hypothetical protein AABW45_03095 [Nanoarchaeota archaeon]